MSDPIYVPADWRPEPGDLAFVTHRDGREELRFHALQSRGWWHSLAGDSNVWRVVDVTLVVRAQVTDPRTHVAIDTTDDAAMKALVGARSAGVMRSHLTALLVTVPEPPLPEPNGLGAVVEATLDGVGGHATYDGGAWNFRSSGTTDYGLAWGALNLAAAGTPGPWWAKGSWCNLRAWAASLGYDLILTPTFRSTGWPVPPAVGDQS